MPDTALQAAIAVTRFGLGARRGEITEVARDPRGWLTAQIRPDGAPAGPAQDSTIDRIRAVARYQDLAREARQLETGSGQDDPAALAAFDQRNESRRALGDAMRYDFMHRVNLGVATEAGFAERWALFWANLFTVSAIRFNALSFIGPLERDVIRPNAFGRFEDMVVAVESHPAMLNYLDQSQSVGPGSSVGRRRDQGLNENLAREALELHTVGSDGGYSQADVTELARALTGWSSPRGALLRSDRLDRSGGFQFRSAVHEPGPRTVMGRTYPEGGVEQGQAILRDLANRPETARRLSHRLAVHFVADEPRPSLIDRLHRAWTGSGGDLAVVARALVQAEESWAPAPEKVKTPYEFMVSTYRALDMTAERPAPMRQALIRMGQPPYTPPSPEGWPDTAADWAGPDALVKRLDWTSETAEQAGRSEPVEVADAVLGARLSDRTRQFVARAESRDEALTFLLMSPEFMRR